MTTSGWDIDGYDSLDSLGSGGDATVYMVRHQKHRYIRALRIQKAIFNIGLEADKVRYAAFEKQIETLLRIGNGNHSHIVRIMPPRLIKMNAVVEMDYIDGYDVADYIKNCRGFVPVDEVLKLVEHMSSALAFCHYDVYRFSIDANNDGVEMNRAEPMNLSETRRQELVAMYRVVHNDIHSKNVRRKYDGNYILLDFNLAVEGDQVVRMSRRGVGVREFWPVERFDEAQDADAHTYSDVYSMGVLFYEFLTGKLPFEEKKDKTQGASLREQHASRPVQDIFEERKSAFGKQPGNHHKTYHKDYPDWLEQVILKMLEKDHNARYQDGKELHTVVLAHLQRDRERRFEEILNAGSGDGKLSLSLELQHLKQENTELIREKEEIGRKENETRGLLESLKQDMTGIKTQQSTVRKSVKEAGDGKWSWRSVLISTFLVAMAASYGGYLFAKKDRAVVAGVPDVKRYIIDQGEAERRYRSAASLIDNGGVPDLDSLRPVAIFYPEYGYAIVAKLNEVIPNITSQQFRFADEKVRNELQQLILKNNDK